VFKRHRTKSEVGLAVERLDERVVPVVHHFRGHAAASFAAPFSGGFVNGQFLPTVNNTLIHRGASRFSAATFGQFGPTSLTSPFPNPGGSFGGLTTPNGAIAFQGNMFAARPFFSFSTSNPFLTTPTPVSTVFPNSGGSFGGLNTPNGGLSFQGSPFSSLPSFNVNGSPGGGITPTPVSPVFPFAGGSFGGFGTVAFQ